ncbi:MAG: glycogen/starch/alpha-glucan phosphorylase [Firmicutes bacterium]|nr:glycogen/starch/alpha-glucan phosphorylase [Bacillota bacterium]
MKKRELITLIEGKLIRHFGRDIETASRSQIYQATALVVRDLMMDNWVETQEKIEKEGAKQVCYFSMEFLLGRSLRNNVFNLGMVNEFNAALAEAGTSLDELYYEEEQDAALGNGGLGRLAASYMDALSCLNYPATGYSILYEYGLFKQKIVDGQQLELPDDWMDSGSSWLVANPTEAVEVHFGGEVEEVWNENQLQVIHKNYDRVLAIPHDMLISGYHNQTVNTLRLWQAKSPIQMNMSLFNEGDYLKASESQAMAEVISKILYPEDRHWEGKSLRLKQQYFFVSASVQEIVRKHMARYGRMDTLPDHVVIQINDTHPAMVVPELMRIMMDENGLTWEESWRITTKTVAYTNHTVMSEALERWPESLFKQVLPRLYQIVSEINRRFCDGLWKYFPGDWDKIASMAILAYDEVRMANLSIAGSFSVNGVSALHSQILRDDVFHDFYIVSPEKFQNVTNGISYRRWIGQSNPGLTDLLTKYIGEEFLEDPEKLRDFRPYAEDSQVRAEFGLAKRANKERLAAYIKEHNGITVDVDSMFDVQAKRLHEYKRQMLNILHILRMYYELKDNPNMDVVPRTFIFGAKAAPGYYAAKQIIRLIHSVGDMINNDPAMQDKMKVVFLEDYKVTVAEILMPAAELSEQISVAGREASGTGNMKFMTNGALTIGTLDGANVEIAEAVGEENIFLFGMHADEVKQLAANGYNPLSYYQNDAWLSRILNALQQGIGREGHVVRYPDIVNSLILGNGHGTADPYMVLADFADYCRAHCDVDNLYRDQDAWNRKAIINVANSSIFASDRSIQDYSERIWHLRKLK